MFIAALIALAAGTTAKIQIDPSQVLNRIQPEMYGSCIEDVNHEIYGGLYAQRIFGESFEELPTMVGPGGWHSLGGSWKSVAGEISASAGAGPKLVRDLPTGEQSTVEAEVRIDDNRDGNAGLLVRVGNASVGADNFDGYEISVDPHAHGLMLGKHFHDFHLLKTAPAPVKTGEWRRITVRLDHARIQVFLDDESAPRIDFTDTDSPLAQGGIALRTWQLPAQFRSVKVDSRPIDLDLKGGVSGMWDPVGNGPFAVEDGAFNGNVCQKIVHGPTGGSTGVANLGLNRWGIAVRAGQAMEGRIAVKGNASHFIVALQSKDGAQTYAAQRLPVTANWQKRSFRLTPNSTDPDAKFCILLDEPGEIWVDEAVLMDGDRFHGLPIRGDIGSGLVDENLRFLRYAGSMVNAPGYRWKKMIGDPDQRPPYEGLWYPYSTNGFGIFDFLKFCEAAHFEGAFAINIEETAQDAADLADYLTAGANNPWGRQRAKDGHPAPFKPAYIEIGNEECLDGKPASLQHYADRFRLLAHAIHSRNPGLKLVCAAWWFPHTPEIKAVFDAIDRQAAAWDFHVWSDAPNSGEAVDEELDEAQKLFKSWNPRTDLKVVIFEENGDRHDQQRALGHATTLNAARRHGDFVIADCPANCLQPLNQNDNGWNQGQLFFTADHTFAMPPYFVQQVLSADTQPLRVAASADQGLDVLASRSEDGRKLRVTIVNISDHPVPTTLLAKGFAVRRSVARTVAGGLTEVNEPIGPPKIAPRVLPLRRDPGGISIDLPPYSVTSVRLDR